LFYQPRITRPLFVDPPNHPAEALILGDLFT
jgi:hypothetical protein